MLVINPRQLVWITTLSLGLAACGGGGGSSSPPPPPPPPPISVTISPLAVQVQTGATQQFTATLTNASNTGATWQVNGKTGGDAISGTISASGLYTAPAAVTDPPTVTITAISQQDTSKSASATVGVTPDVLALDVWFGPAAQSTDFQTLFTQADQWSTARSKVKVFTFYPYLVSFTPCPSCSPNGLQQFINVQAFSKLKDWGINIAVEEGVVEPAQCSGDLSASAGAEDNLKDIDANGGILRIISMDEPYYHGLPTLNGPSCNFTMHDSAVEAAKFINDLHAKYVYLVIGDSEPYPGLSVAQLESWILELQSLGVKPAFFHLDVDPDYSAALGTDLPGDLQALNAFCRAQAIPFGVFLDALYATTNAMYYSTAMSFITRVKAAIGKPQNSVFQSFDYDNGSYDLPINLPENDPAIFSHSRLINDGSAILGQ